MEVECVPEDILGLITKETKLLTLSIGAGKKSDVQFLFAEDILGCSTIDTPRHAKMYVNFNKLNDIIQKERIKAFKKFSYEVKNNQFPAKKHSISIDKVELEKFKKLISNKKYN